MIDTAAILSRVKLSELIERHAETSKMTGRVFCPFCQTASRNTPALSIHDQHWHCFGCGAGGDAFDFIMQLDNVDFLEAARRLGWDGAQPDPQELTRRAAENEQRRQAEAIRKAHELDILLAEYTAEEIWSAYNRRMTQANKDWWEKRGVPVEWQDYLRLGYLPDKTYRGKDSSLLHSPAYTIPYFHDDFKFQTMQYRLENPERPQDRYRFEIGLEATYYQTDPSNPIGEWAIICEGAIKGMVTKVYGDTGTNVQVLAIPARDSSGGVADAVAHCKRVWICLDPDCWIRPENAAPAWEPAPIKLAKMVGKNARIVNLPGKIDDMILAGSLESFAWKQALKTARSL